MALGDSPNSPLFVKATDGGADQTSAGNITTQNLVPAGAATAGSAVEITLDGRDTVVVQVLGTYTGVLSVQGSIDGTNWTTLGGNALQRLSDSSLSATIPSAATGLFTAAAVGLEKLRITGLAAMTGTAAIVLVTTDGDSGVFIDGPLPAGSAVIGSLANVATIGTSVTPGTAAANLGKAEDAIHGSGDVGVMALAVINTSAATAFAASGDYGPIAVDVNGALFVKPKPALTNGTPAAFALTANTNTAILAANAARRKALIVNRSGQTVFLRIGAAATSSLYSWELAQGEKWEVPEGITGQINALSTLAGSAVAAGVGLFVTEFTD